MDLINKYKMLTYALVLGIIFAVSSAGAADFTNSESGTINNKGTLRIKGDRKFRNAAIYGNITNEGTFEFTGNGKFTDAPEDPQDDNENGSTALGNDATWRVPGTTLWSGTAAQTLQPRWYEDLSTDNGGVKSFNNGSFYVSGVYAPLDGDRDYGTSNFYYDGTESQDIVGENGASGGNNVYYNLVMQNAGVKTIQDGQTANVENNVQIESSSTSLFTIAGILNSGNTLTQEAGAGNINISAATSELNLGAGASEFNGGVDVAGSLTTVGEGLATFNGGIDVTTTGSFNLVAGDAVIAETSTLALGDNALINVSADRTLTVTGVFTNDDNDQSNLTFDIASKVIYNNSSIVQNIIVTSANNPFGNLTISGESKTPLGDIFIAGNISLADKNLSMGNNTLTMLTADKTADYVNGTEEVVGKMKRMYDAGTESYTFNNANTTVTFTDAAGTDTYMELDVQPTTAPLTYVNNTDVNRKITLSYNFDSFNANIKAGYKPDELPETYEDGLSESDLKFFEADDQPMSEKLAGANYGRGTTGDLRYLSFEEIENSTGGVDGVVERGFTSGHDLVLRASNQMYSIASGRWSNPATWDEGREPTSLDNVTIADGTQVHAGGTAPNRDNYTNDETYIVDGPGDGETQNTGFVKSITIQDNAALVFGNSTFTYALATGAKITNNANYEVNSNSFSEFLNTAPGAFTGRGLIIYEGLLRSNEITNSGLLWIDESATVEVGD